jgi:hypothetical protein
VAGGLVAHRGRRALFLAVVFFRTSHAVVQVCIADGLVGLSAGAGFGAAGLVLFAAQAVIAVEARLALVRFVAGLASFQVLFALSPIAVIARLTAQIVPQAIHLAQVVVAAQMPLAQLQALVVAWLARVFYAVGRVRVQAGAVQHGAVAHGVALAREVGAGGLFAGVGVYGFGFAGRLGGGQGLGAGARVSRI